MALAAGMPVPDVYLMDEEDGINAFAAGHTPGDAVRVGVVLQDQRLGRGGGRGQLLTEDRGDQRRLAGPAATEYRQVETTDFGRLLTAGLLEGSQVLSFVVGHCLIVAGEQLVGLGQ